MFDPKDNRVTGYHLFLLPQGELFRTLEHTIRELKERFNGVLFEPHITLLARIPEQGEEALVEKTRQLATTMKPFEVQLKEIGMEDVYFRALYLKAEPNELLQNFHKKAQTLFHVEDNGTYMPHLSLYYGNTPSAVKRTMVESLSLPEEITMTVDRVCLYRTEGEADAWVRVGEYPFTSSNGW